MPARTIAPNEREDIHKFKLGIAAVLTASALVAGCGGGGETASDVTSTSTDATHGEVGQGAVVDAGDLYFSPEKITVSAGDEVVWQNVGETTHTVKGDDFFSKAINPGDSYATTFDKAGSYDYQCTLHPTQMTGKISVSK